jgi:hypothetical protein
MGYIAPSQTVADRWTAAPSVAVGCPKLDQYIGKVQPFNNVETPEVCFAWHWDCTLVPETRTAWPHYEHDFAEIVERFRLQGFRVTAHEHPKWRGAMNKIMESHGVEIRHSDTEVLTNAHVLFVDNSSLAYEFAALNKPVFLLNAPWYRREIEHGLRFWSYPPGLEIQNPEELLKYNLWDILHRSPDQLISEFRREAAVAHAYAFVDGQSSVRAAEWITNLVG